MPYIAPLAEDSKEVCNNCKERAKHLWESPTGNVYSKCDKHLKEVQDAEERFNSIQPFSGRNEYGEFYDEDSY